MNPKQIRFNGLSAVPSDYDAPDGDLLLSLNLINEDSALHPLLPPKHLYSVDSGFRFLLQHTVNGSGLVHHIFCNEADNSILFRSNVEDAAFTPIQSSFSDPVIDAVAIGNMVVLSRTDSLEYILWKQDELSYISLGSGIPRLDLKFSLNAEFFSNKTYSLGHAPLSFIKAQDALIDYDDKSNESISEVVSGIIPENSLTFGNTAFQIEGLDLVEGRLYQFNLEYSGPFMNWALYYGSVGCDNPVEACNGLYGGSKQFVAAHAGPAFIVVYYIVDEEYVGQPCPYRFAYSVSAVSSGSDVDPDVLVLANTVDNENAVAGVANRFVAEEAYAKNRFIAPFLARFAVRLFDGSYISVSDPVLLVPNSANVPFIHLYGHDGEYWANAFAFIASLVVSFNPPENFNQWESIIDGVDIFVSEPAHLYNQGHVHSDRSYPFANIALDGDFNGMFSISRLCKGSFLVNGEVVAKNDFKTAFLNAGPHEEVGALSYGVVFAPRSQTEITDDVKDKAVFYKFASIDFQTLLEADGWFSPSVEKGSLSNLVTRPVLSDDLVYFDSFSSASLHIYNSRLHVYNASVSLPDPVPPFFLSDLPEQFISDVFIRIHLNSDEGKKTIFYLFPQRSVSTSLLWFYYPYSRAFRFEMVAVADGGFLYWDIPLSPHPFLNGAYAVSSSLDEPFSPSLLPGNPLASFSPASTRLLKSSSVFVSEVNNPYIFKSSMAFSIPSNHLIGLASAAKALSQGQFGQFPLYAFSDQGVWAVELSADGRYVSRQPITRDVCISPHSITQIDSAVLFATSGGIMLISGSQTQCISDILGSPLRSDSVSSCSGPWVGGLSAELVNAGALCRLSEDFLQDCRIAYVYSSQRLIIFNPSFPYAFLYSLRSRLWGMMESSLSSPVNVYPDALAMAAGEEGSILVDLADSDASSVPVSLVSRPLKLDTPDILKTVSTVVLRGILPKSGVELRLFATRDYIHWHPVAASRSLALRAFRGSPYKAFRLDVRATLTPSESISACSIYATPRLTNRLR